MIEQMQIHLGTIEEVEAAEVNEEATTNQEVIKAIEVAIEAIEEEGVETTIIEGTMATEEITIIRREEITIIRNEEITLLIINQVTTLKKLLSPHILRKSLLMTKVISPQALSLEEDMEVEVANMEVEVKTQIDLSRSPIVNPLKCKQSCTSSNSLIILQNINPFTIKSLRVK